jgi:hypothetical protein
MYSTDNGPHFNSWPDAGITPFRAEKNTNWEGGWRVPAFVRWPGKFKAGTVINGIVSHQDWLPTLLAAVGEDDVKEKLVNGCKVGEKSFKVHIDGYNMLPYLTGQAKESPRESFFYISDDGDIMAIRMKDWKVVTDLPNWLSMSTIVSTFEGGAHPNYVYDAILWDKTANLQREALDLFTSKKALSAAIGQAFCDAIDRQRTKKRGEPIVRESGDMFTNCLDPLDYTIILGSAGRRGFDRIGILVPPYEAGPYAEGGYEVTLPVTAKVLALVKPEYRASFVVGR